MTDARLEEIRKKVTHDREELRSHTFGDPPMIPAQELLDHIATLTAELEAKALALKCAIRYNDEDKERIQMHIDDSVVLYAGWSVSDVRDE
tara:strand:- start:211 stop:483 length:273 start_codon:yes stop_codon:yes gene_type:complete